MLETAAVVDQLVYLRPQQYAAVITWPFIATVDFHSVHKCPPLSPFCSFASMPPVNVIACNRFIRDVFPRHGVRTSALGLSAMMFIAVFSRLVIGQSRHQKPHLF